MTRKLLSVMVITLALTAMAGNAQAIGVYADVPLDYTFSECTGTCDFDISGLKAGLILPSNIGLGIESYKVEGTGSNQGNDVEFQFADVSYLLPIPAINITGGAGFGNVTLTQGNTNHSDTATQLWGSLGFTFAAIIDLHFAYHVVNASVDVASVNNNLDGKMISFGAMILF